MVRVSAAGGHRHGDVPGMGPVTPLRVVLLVLLVLLFVIEVIGLVAVGWWAVRLDGIGGIGGVLVAIAAVAAMAALWGLFAAPKANHRLRGIPLAGFMLAWFTVGAACLAAVGHPWWGIALVIGFAATKGLLALTGGADSAPAVVQAQGPDIGE